MEQQLDRSKEVRKLNVVVNEYIFNALVLCMGDRTKTARMLGIDRKTLYRKLSDMGVPLARLGNESRKQQVAQTRTLLDRPEGYKENAC